MELMGSRDELEEKVYHGEERIRKLGADLVAFEEEMEHWKCAAEDRNQLREDVEVSLSYQSPNVSVEKMIEQVDLSILRTSSRTPIRRRGGA